MPAPPAAPIEEELTSRVTPQRPASGVGESTVVDEEPHPDDAPPRIVMSASAETNRYRGIGGLVPEAGTRHAVFFGNSARSHVADVDILCGVLQRITSDVCRGRGAIYGLGRRLRHAARQVSSASSTAGLDSKFGNRRHTDGAGVDAPFKSAIPVASARPPRKLFTQVLKRVRPSGSARPLTDDDRLW